MGTKFEYAINVLAPSQKTGSYSVIHLVDDQTKGLNHTFQITRLHKYQTFMSNQIPQKYNMEFIRSTMQIHEDIFKQQVRELHRLYSTQKMLMEEMKRNNKKYSFKIEKVRSNEQSPRERSGSCSGDQQQTIRIMTKGGFDLETPAVLLNNVVVGPEEDLSTGISRICNNESEEEGEIELTLSIGSSSGGNFKNKKLKNHQEIVSFSDRRDQGLIISAPTTPISSSRNATTSFNQETKHPHWLLQGLNINGASST